MKRLLYRLWFAAALLVAAAIISFGALVTVGHLVAPMASNYRAEVEKTLTAAIGQPVTVKTLTGRWKGYGPELVLRNVALYTSESNSPQLELPEVRISISLINTLLNQALTPRQITLIAPHLRINRETDGTLSIAGITLEVGKGSSEGELNLPSHFRIRNGTITYVDKTIDRQPIKLSQLDLKLRSDEARHQLSLSASLTEQQPKQLTAELDIHSDNPTDLSTWDTKIHLYGSAVPLREIVDKLPNYPHKLPAGTTDFETWGNINGGQLTELSGSIGINQLIFDVRKKDNNRPATPLQVDHIGTEFSWTGNIDDWTLDFLNLTTARDGHAAQMTNLKLVGSKSQLQLGVEHIDLAEVTTLLPAILPIDHDVLAPLSHIQPKGVIKAFRLGINTDQQQQWQMSGQLTEFSSKPWKDYPGVEKLSTSFSANANQAYFGIDSSDATLTFSNLFREPLALNKLQGGLRWKQINSSDWMVYSERLVADSPDIKSTTRLRLEQIGKDQQLHLDLQTDYRDGNSSNTFRYLPVGIMGKPVVSWLDNSIGKGTVPQGSVIVRGPLGDFPYHQKSTGRFEVFFRTKALKLDYWPEWPELKNISANVRFLNNRFDVWVKGAKILNSRVKSAHGQIRDLAKTSPFELRGLVEGPLSDNLKLLSESPLKEDFGPMVKDLKASKRSRLAIEFAIPIDSGVGKDRLQGKLSFLDAKLDLNSWQLSLDHITGNLNFDLDGITGKGLRGEIAGTPITVDVATPKEVGKVTRITARGDIPTQQLQQRFPDIGLLKRMSGSSDWTLQLDIPHTSAGAGASTQVNASSDLNGVQIDAPMPVGKTTEGHHFFQLSTQFNDQTTQLYEIQLGTLLNAKLLLETLDKKPPTLIGLNVGLGTKIAAEPANGKIDVAGQIEELALDSWIEEMKLAQAEPGSGELSLDNLNIDITRLMLKQTTLEDISINVSQDSGQWNTQFSSNKATGQLTIPADLETDPIRLTLDSLKLSFDPDQDTSEPEAEATPEDKLNPTRVPALDVEIKQLFVNDHLFGRVQLNTRKTDSGLELTNLHLDSELLKLDATGYWHQDSSQNQITSIKATASTSVTATLLQTLGFTQNLKGAPIEIDTLVTWPLTPIDYRRDTLTGDIRMQVGKGQFLDVDPGVGRIFGLLNLAALQRRLTLDFTDIFQKGFAFDSIEGNFILDKGDAYTNDFTIKGPAAGIDISGRIGLVNHDLDQNILVTPKISSTLPIAGAIAGGPAVGAALFLAQTLLGSTLDQITRIEYSAVGPWDNPTFTRHQASQSNESNANDQDFEESFTVAPSTGKDWQLPSDLNSDRYPLAEPEPSTQRYAIGSNSLEDDISPASKELAEDTPPENSEKEPASVFNFLNKLKPTGQTFKQSAEEAQQDR